MTNLIETIEAIIFASGKSIKKSDIIEKLPDEVSRKDLNQAISELAVKYSGDSGILLLVFNDKVQFSSNPKYGDIVADVLKPLKEKELSKTLLEVLSIIAYKQPITRLEIEEIRGVSSEYAVSTLAKVNLIQPVGRKDTVGRPTLFGTSEEFLKKFQLHALDELPDYETVMEHLKSEGLFNESSESLYRTIPTDPAEGKPTADGTEDASGGAERANYANTASQAAADVLSEQDMTDTIIDTFMSTDEIPDFLQDDEFEVVE